MQQPDFSFANNNLKSNLLHHMIAGIWNEPNKGRERERKKMTINKQRHCLWHSCCCFCCWFCCYIVSFTQHLAKLHSLLLFFFLQMQLDFFHHFHSLQIFFFINVNFFSVMLSWWWCFSFLLLIFFLTKKNPFAGKEKKMKNEKKYYMNIYK